MKSRSTFTFSYLGTLLMHLRSDPASLSPASFAFSDLSPDARINLSISASSINGSSPEDTTNVFFGPPSKNPSNSTSLDTAPDTSALLILSCSIQIQISSPILLMNSLFSICNITLVIPRAAPSRLLGVNTSTNQPLLGKNESSTPRHSHDTTDITGEQLPIALFPLSPLSPNLMNSATVTDAPSPSTVLLSRIIALQTLKTFSFQDMPKRGVQMQLQSPRFLLLNSKSTHKVTELPRSNFHLETCAIVFPDVPACASEFSKYLDSITVSASRIAETGHISILAMNLPPPEKIRLSSHLSYR